MSENPTTDTASESSAVEDRVAPSDAVKDRGSLSHTTDFRWHPIETAPRGEHLVVRGPAYRSTVCLFPCPRCAQRATEWRYMVEEIDI